MDNKVDREWLDGEVTITREKLGKILVNETKTVLMAAIATGNKDLYNLLKEVLNEFCASVGVAVFKELEDEEER